MYVSTLFWYAWIINGIVTPPTCILNRGKSTILDSPYLNGTILASCSENIPIWSKLDIVNCASMSLAGLKQVPRSDIPYLNHAFTIAACQGITVDAHF
jgi:hypothetical protein